LRSLLTPIHSFKEIFMTRKTLWQLSAIAAAAGLICVAQAQTTDTSAESQAAPEATMSDAWSVPYGSTEAAPSETDVQAVLNAEQQATVPPVDTAAGETVLNTVPADSSTASSSAMPAKRSVHVAAAAPAPAQQVSLEPEPLPVIVSAADLPPTREDVKAEAKYANQHGLIPHGELSMVDEDKSGMRVERGEANRIARAETIRLAQVASATEVAMQQWQARENARQLALQQQEQQRQAAVAQAAADAAAQQAQQDQVAASTR
jgi:hypothetical protein